MALFDTFKQTKKSHWVTVDLSPDDKPMRFELAYLSGTNKKMAKLSAQLQKPYRKLIDKGTLPDNVADELALKTFVKGILLGWENIIVKEGDDPLEYTEENAMWLFKELPELLQYLMAQSAELSNFQTEGDEEAAKNS